ncbi:hypothetical protein [Methylobacillus sp.]|uniref:hypothetical protein n=1 Tax=Methylobacillus sp. TaxID=56818 RepID=UPI0012BDD4A1|nr:hypothetical protein [Methylobacillus sp.]MPS48548.1 hypothetical protein [Methylobacillus sp.]
MIYEALYNILIQKMPDVFIEGETLFINQMPAEREFGGMFRDTPTGIERDGYVTSERRGTFVFALRGNDYARLSSAIERVMEALTIHGVESGGYLIKNCYATLEPIFYQISLANMTETSVTFSIVYGKI